VEGVKDVRVSLKDLKKKGTNNKTPLFTPGQEHERGVPHSIAPVGGGTADHRRGGGRGVGVAIIDSCAPSGIAALLGPGRTRFGKALITRSPQGALPRIPSPGDLIRYPAAAAGGWHAVVQRRLVRLGALHAAAGRGASEQPDAQWWRVITDARELPVRPKRAGRGHPDTQPSAVPAASATPEERERLGAEVRRALVVVAEQDDPQPRLRLERHEGRVARNGSGVPDQA